MSVVEKLRRLSCPKPSRPNWRRKLTMLASVRVRGCVPVWIAYCSAGRPNESKPNACNTLRPVIR